MRRSLRQKNFCHKVGFAADCLHLSEGQWPQQCNKRGKIPAAGPVTAALRHSICSSWSSNCWGSGDFWVHTGTQSLSQHEALQTVHSEEVKTDGTRENTTGFLKTPNSCVCTGVQWDCGLIFIFYKSDFSLLIINRSGQMENHDVFG